MNGDISELFWGGCNPNSPFSSSFLSSSDLLVEREVDGLWLEGLLMWAVCLLIQSLVTVSSSSSFVWTNSIEIE